MFRGTLSVITRIIWSIKLPNQWTNGTVDVCRCLHNLTYCYLPKIIIISHFVPQLTLAKKITFDFGHYFRSWQIGLFLQRKLAKYQYHGQLCNNNSTLLFLFFTLNICLILNLVVRVIDHIYFLNWFLLLCHKFSPYGRKFIGCVSFLYSQSTSYVNKFSILSPPFCTSLHLSICLSSFLLHASHHSTSHMAGPELC